MENSAQQESTDLLKHFADEPEQVTHSPVQPVMTTEPTPSKSNPMYLYLLIGLLVLMVIGMFFLRRMAPITPKTTNEIPLSLTEVPVSPTGIPVTPTVQPESVATTSASSTCISGYKFYEGELFSICYPDSMSSNLVQAVSNDPSLPRGERVEFKNATQELSVQSDFQGGWGGSPCLVTQPVLIAGYTSTRMNWKTETDGECGSGYANFVTLVNSDVFENHFPFSIDLRTETTSFSNDSVMKVIEKSFKVK